MRDAPIWEAWHDVDQADAEAVQRHDTRRAWKGALAVEFLRFEP